MKKAVIDLGTNTCNLLIADVDKNTFVALHRQTLPVCLGKTGIEKNILTNDSFERASLVITQYQQKCKEMGCHTISIFATSAVRSAENKEAFVNFIKSKNKIDIQVISGTQEADYIFKGVQSAVDLKKAKLILDIGGGSNEFIIAKDGKKLWQKSFNLGMARIIKQFEISNPINKTEFQQIKDFFDKELEELWKATDHIDITELIGCAGAFDTFADLINNSEAGTVFRQYEKFANADVVKMNKRLIQSTLNERIKMKGMVEIRAIMILPALILVQLVQEKLNIQQISCTGYALCEGAITNDLLLFLVD